MNISLFFIKLNRTLVKKHKNDKLKKKTRKN